MQVTRSDELVTVAQAAELAGVDEKTIRNWIYRGYFPREHSKDNPLPRRYLAVAKREGWLILLDPIEVAKAEWHTAGRARRVSAAERPSLLVAA